MAQMDLGLEPSFRLQAWCWMGGLHRMAQLDLGLEPSDEFAGWVLDIVMF